MAGRPPPAPSPFAIDEVASYPSDDSPGSPLSRLVQEGYIGVPTASNRQSVNKGVARQGVNSLEQMRAGHQQQKDPNYAEKLTNIRYKVAPGGRSSFSLGWEDSAGSVAEPLRRGRGVGDWAPLQSRQDNDMAGCLGQGLTSHPGNASVSRPTYRSLSPAAFGAGVAGTRSSSRDAGGMASCLESGTAPHQFNRASRRAASPAMGSVEGVASAGYRENAVCHGGMAACMSNAAYESRAPPAYYTGLGVLPGMGSA